MKISLTILIICGLVAFQKANQNPELPPLDWDLLTSNRQIPVEGTIDDPKNEWFIASELMEVER